MNIKNELLEAIEYINTAELHELRELKADLNYFISQLIEIRKEELQNEI